MRSGDAPRRRQNCPGGKQRHQFCRRHGDGVVVLTDAGINDTTFSGDGILPWPATSRLADTFDEAVGPLVLPEIESCLGATQSPSFAFLQPSSTPMAAALMNPSAVIGQTTCDPTLSTDAAGRWPRCPAGQIFRRAPAMENFVLVRYDGRVTAAVLGSGGVVSQNMRVLACASQARKLITQPDGKVVVTGFREHRLKQ